MKLQVTSFSLAANHSRPCDDACLTRELNRGGMVAAVADGIGSARAGGEAARRAVEMLCDYFSARPEAWSFRRALAEFVDRINRHLHHEAALRFESPELATTLSAVVLAGDRLYGVNLGDSPVYLWRGGRLIRLSQPHVSELPGQEHVLTRGIGLEPHADPHFFEMTLAAGDRVVLCTDGVSGPIRAEGIGEACRRSLAARSLVVSAHEACATDADKDDATAVIVEIHEIGEAGAEGQRLEVVPRLRKGDEFQEGILVRPLDESDRVWLATGDLGSVVLKFPPVEAGDDEARAEGFLREAWQAARLDSNEFVRAHVPSGPVLRYYVQDYIDAPTLRSVLGAGPLPVEGAIALGRFLARAAQTLVRHNLAHGDLKPENILVVRSGGPWDFRLIDLGIAAPMFSTTHRAGTASYLAPERFHEAPVSERTEVFTIGVILYEALAGRLPFGEIERFQSPRFNAAVKPVSRFNISVPHWLDSIVQRAIAPVARERYQYYSEIVHDLEHPDQVEPFHRASAPLLERNPVRFFKWLCVALLLLNILQLWLRMSGSGSR